MIATPSPDQPNRKSTKTTTRSRAWSFRDRLTDTSYRAGRFGWFVGRLKPIRDLLPRPPVVIIEMADHAAHPCRLRVIALASNWAFSRKIHRSIDLAHIVAGIFSR